MKKKFLLRAIALVAYLTCTLGARAADYDFIHDNLKYVITSSTTAKVVGVAVSSPSGTWAVPATANGYKVTEIAENAFSNCSSITAIGIGSNVTTIGASAFDYCSGLTRVNIYNLTAWCNITFSGNAWSNPLAYAHHLYLNNTEVTNLVVPEGVQSLGDLVFYGCQGLSSVTLPSNLTSIGWSCFNGCSNLKTVTLGSNLNKITDHAFGNCTSLTNITCLASTPPTIRASNAFDDATYSGATLTVPKSFKSVYQADSYWSNFTTINELPYSFVANGIYYAITGSNTVEVTYKDTGYNTYSGSVTIPSSVTHNGTTYQVTAIGQHAFDKSTTLTSVTIPSTVTTMGNYAFDDCTGLTRVNISDLAAWCRITFQSTADSNPLYYAHHLYYYGTEITELTVPDGVEELGAFVFYGCQALTSVTLPSSLTSIGWSCFNKCSSLVTLTLGRNLTRITDHAFANCTALTTVTCMATTPPTMSASNVFSNATYSQATLYVPKSCKSTYQAASYWSNFTTIQEQSYDFVVNGIYYNITGNNTVEVTYKNTNYNSYSGSVTIPGSVTYNDTTYHVTAIGRYAFCRSNTLTSITIPSTVTTMGIYAFNGCEGLTRVNISNLAAWCRITFESSADANPLSYAHHLYLNGTEITELTVPEGVQELGSFVFYTCEGLTRVTIANSVTSIGWSAFCYCANLRTLTLGSNLNHISCHAFEDCPNLTTVTCLAMTPPTMDDANVFDNSTYSGAILYVPYNCRSAYQAANYWSNFTYIWELPYSFIVNGIYYKITGSNTVEVSCNENGYNSYGGTVNIPSSVTYNGTTYQVTAIGNNAFYYCPDLANVIIPTSVTTIGRWAFMSCSSLKNITIPSSVTKINSGALGSCDSLTSVTCLASTPPVAVVNDTTDTYLFSRAKLFVPKASINAYKAATYWKKFTTVHYHLQYALNVEGGTIEFTSTGDYPWTNAVDGERVYAQCGNKGVHSSTSTLTATVDVPVDGTLSFDFKAWGEATSWDVCQFWVDDTQMFSYGNRDNEWETYTVELAAGTHTLTWFYRKDYSVNPTGDYFAVDNVTLTIPDTYLLMNDANVVAGGTVTVPVAMVNLIPFNRIQADIILPEGFELLDIEKSSRVDDNAAYFGFSNSDLTDSQGRRYRRVAIVSWSAEPCVTGTEGDLFYIKLNAPGNATGDYALALDNIIYYEELNTPKDVAGAQSYIHVTGHILGDINGDGVIDVADLTELISIVLNGTPISLDIADINSDGEVDVIDVTSLISIVLNGN